MLRHSGHAPSLTPQLVAYVLKRFMYVCVYEYTCLCWHVWSELSVCLLLFEAWSLPEPHFPPLCWKSANLSNRVSACILNWGHEGRCLGCYLGAGI